jgi:protein-disulfide isomerase
MIARLGVLLILFMLPTPGQAQQFGPARFPITADDGDPISNHALRADEMKQVAGLPGLVEVSGGKGDVTLYQFYDLNCPFCREAAADVDDLIRTDPALRLVFVPYPVLSVQSVAGARVELALRALGTPRQFLEFHRKIYAGRGVIDGDRALAVAQAMGFDRQKIIDAANGQNVTTTMTAHARLGTTLKLMATPAYIVAGVAILGHPGLEALRKIVASVRRCKAAVC